MTAGVLDRVLPDCRPLLRLEGEDSSIFVRKDAPRWLVVNTLGAEVFNLCDGRRSVREVARVISGIYERPLTEVQSDVLSFWSDVEESGFFAELAPQPEPSSEVKIASLHLYVTTRCNQSCSFCAVQGAFSDGDMPAELFRDAVRQSVALGAARIVVTGGEPFLKEDLLELLRSVEGVAPVQVLTNGTLISSAKARELAELRASVQVSLDGASAETHDSIRGEGAFEAALRSIRLLRDVGVNPLTISFTIQEANSNDIAGVLELSEREGVGEAAFMPVIPGVEGERRFQHASSDSIITAMRQVEQYRGPVAAAVTVPGFGKDAVCGERWCTPGLSPSIGPEGSVFPCTSFARTPFLAGKMPDSSLEEMLGGKVTEGLRQACRERVDRIEECASCVWKHFCRAGCPALAYHEHGDLLAKDCFCEARKRIYRAVFLGG